MVTGARGEPAQRVPVVTVMLRRCCDVELPSAVVLSYVFTLSMKLKTLIMNVDFLMFEIEVKDWIGNVHNQFFQFHLSIWKWRNWLRTFQITCLKSNIEHRTERPQSISSISFINMELKELIVNISNKMFEIKHWIQNVYSQFLQLHLSIWNWRNWLWTFQIKSLKSNIEYRTSTINFFNFIYQYGIEEIDCEHFK